MYDTLFDGLDVLYQCAKFGEDRTTRAGCRCENMVFVCFLPAGLNLLRASVAKKQHFSPYRKNYALNRKMIETF